MKAFCPTLRSGAYHLTVKMQTHLGWIGEEEPLTYMCHTLSRKGPARVNVATSSGARFYVDADFLAETR